MDTRHTNEKHGYEHGYMILPHFLLDQQDRLGPNIKNKQKFITKTPIQSDEYKS